MANKILGGENIAPLEIEERLMPYPSILEASIVGLPNERYGEVVGAFLRSDQASSVRPSHSELVVWVRQTLGRQKAPEYIFWLGDEDIGADFPKTGSGKIQKHILRRIGGEVLKQRQQSKAKL